MSPQVDAEVRGARREALIRLVDKLVLIRQERCFVRCICAHPLQPSDGFEMAVLIAHDSLRGRAHSPVNDDEARVPVLDLEESHVRGGFNALHWRSDFE